MICAATYFTEKWCYAADSWLEHFCVSASKFQGCLIVANDESPACADKLSKIKKRVGRIGWECHSIIISANDLNNDYGAKAMMIIAKMQHKCFSKARELGATQFWSSEIDVFPAHNSLSVLKQMLEFDDGYYSVAMATYPNGLFLGGRGSPQEHICQDFYPDEKNIPLPLKEKMTKQKKKAEEFYSKIPTPSEVDEYTKEAHEIANALKAIPPRGNIFAMQGKNWRRRGWMEFAYPGIGLGAVLPTDWVGLGCTLLDRRALSLAMYDGYDLRGTQDLYLCWRKWNPAGLRMCVVPHVPCSHAKREVGKANGEIIYYEASHETSEPKSETVGHLRQRPCPFIDFH